MRLPSVSTHEDRLGFMSEQAIQAPECGCGYSYPNTSCHSCIARSSASRNIASTFQVCLCWEKHGYQLFSSLGVQLTKCGPQHSWGSFRGPVWLDLSAKVLLLFNIFKRLREGKWKVENVD